MHQVSPIVRRKSRQIMVGNVPVGGDAPITVQSMTNTETTDVAATVAQIRALENAGADIVRVSVPSMEAAEAFGKIRQQVSVPLVSDIHFDYKIALRVLELGVDCLRINPGNIGKEDRVRTLVAGAVLVLSVCPPGRCGARQKRTDPHRRECRFAGKRSAKEISRALRRCDGRVCP